MAGGGVEGEAHTLHEGQEVGGGAVFSGGEDVGVLGGDVGAADAPLLGAEAVEDGAGGTLGRVAEEGTAAAEAGEVGALGSEGGAAFLDGGGVGGVKAEGDGDDGEAGETADRAVAGGEGVGGDVAELAVGEDATDLNDAFPEGVAVGAGVHAGPSADGAGDALHEFEAGEAVGLEFGEEGGAHEAGADGDGVAIAYVAFEGGAAEHAEHAAEAEVGEPGVGAGAVDVDGDAAPGTEGVEGGECGDGVGDGQEVGHAAGTIEGVLREGLIHAEVDFVFEDVNEAVLGRFWGRRCGVGGGGWR